MNCQICSVPLDPKVDFYVTLIAPTAKDTFVVCETDWELIDCDGTAYHPSIHLGDT